MLGFQSDVAPHLGQVFVNKFEVLMLSILRGVTDRGHIMALRNIADSMKPSATDV